MKKFNVLIDDVNLVKEFVKAVSVFDKDVYAESGRYVINAKSIMGLFSIDLSKSIQTYINSEDENEIAAFERAITKFIVQ